MLIQQLYWRFPQQEDAVRWQRYLDWFLPLPRQDEGDIWQRLVQEEKEKNVTFLSVGERIGLEKGKEDGLRRLLRARFGASGEGLLTGRQWTLSDEAWDILYTSLLKADSLEKAREALEQSP